MLVIDKGTGKEFWVAANHSMSIDNVLDLLDISVNDDGQLVEDGETIDAWYDDLITGGDFRCMVEDFIADHEEYEDLKLDREDPTWAEDDKNTYSLTCRNGEIIINYNGTK